MTDVSGSKSFEDALYIIFQDLSNKTSTNFNVPALTEHELRVSAKTLSEYLTLYIKRHKRRTKTPLYPKNLALDVLRTCNPNEVVVKGEGKNTKGTQDGKDWYYLALSEVDIGQEKGAEILVEGNMRKGKGELLEAFREKVEMQVWEWESK
jgi:hypothetical protein